MLTRKSSVRPVLHVRNVCAILLMLVMGGCVMDEPVGNQEFEQAFFVPVLQVTDAEGIVYADSRGFYTRLGQWVHVDFEIEYTNLAPAQNETEFALVPPFQPSKDAIFHSFVGPVDISRSAFGFQASQFTTAQTVLDAAHAGPDIVIRGRAGTLDSDVSLLLLGSAQEERIVVGSIDYVTDGEYLY